MRVGIVTGPGDIKEYGGKERYVIELSHRLIKAGIDVTIFSQIGRVNRIDSATLRRMTSARITYFRALRILRTPESILLGTSAAKMFKALRRLDVVYNVHAGMAMNSVLNSYCTRNGIRYVLGMHNPKGVLSLPLYSNALRRALYGIYLPFRKASLMAAQNIHVLNSEDKRVLESIGYNRRSIYFVPNFIGIRKPKSITANRKEFIVLAVSRLSIRQKGIDLLDEVIRSTLQKKSKIKFYIVGSGDGSADDGSGIVKRLSAAYPENVRWFGFVDEEKLQRLYGEASLFVSTSRYESFLLTLTEAQAHGLPAVTFDIRGPHDIISKSFQGIRVSPFSVADFQNAILQYYSAWMSGSINSALREKISRYIFGKYGSYKVIPQIIDMLRGRQNKANIDRKI